MTILEVGKSAVWIGAMGAVAGCGWDYLDAIGPAASADAAQNPDASNYVVAFAPEGAAEAAADHELAEAPADDEATEVSAEEAGTPSDSTTTDVAGPADASSAEGAAPAGPCMGSPTVLRQWTFDSDGQSWTLSMNPSVQGRLAWNGGMGDPAPGALEIDIGPGSADAGTAKLAWARYNAMALGDLSGRTISAWVWFDKGAPPQFKLFVQTGSQYAWADNGTFTINAGTWTCVSLSLSSPAYNAPGYDPTSVVALGIEARVSAPVRLLIDTVRYY